MKKIRLSLDLTPEMKVLLERLAEESGVDQGEILRRAIALFNTAKQAEAAGESIATVKDGKIVARLIGF